MKIRLLFVLVAFALAAVGTLAVMNNACRTGQHEWCAPESTARHHTARNG
jgi:hypothetical protein